MQSEINHSILSTELAFLKNLPDYTGLKIYDKIDKLSPQIKK